MVMYQSTNRSWNWIMALSQYQQKQYQARLRPTCSIERRSTDPYTPPTRSGHSMLREGICWPRDGQLQPSISSHSQRTVCAEEEVGQSTVMRSGTQTYPGCCLLLSNSAQLHPPVVALCEQSQIWSDSTGWLRVSSQVDSV